MCKGIAKRIRDAIKQMKTRINVQVLAKTQSSAVKVIVSGSFFDSNLTADENFADLRKVIQCALDSYCQEKHHWIVLKFETPMTCACLLSDGIRVVVDENFQFHKADIPAPPQACT